jgi:hypothetical protein
LEAHVGATRGCLEIVETDQQIPERDIISVDIVNAAPSCRMASGTVASAHT